MRSENTSKVAIPLLSKMDLLIIKYSNYFCISLVKNKVLSIVVVQKVLIKQRSISYILYFTWYILTLPA